MEQIIIPRKRGRPRGLTGPEYNQYPYLHLDSANVLNLVAEIPESIHVRKRTWNPVENVKDFTLYNQFWPYYTDMIPGRPLNFEVHILKRWKGAFYVKVNKSKFTPETDAKLIYNWIVTFLEPHIKLYWESWPKTPRYAHRRTECTRCGRKEDYFKQYSRTYCENCNSLQCNIKKKLYMIKEKQIPKENLFHLIKQLKQEIKIYEIISGNPTTTTTGLTDIFLNENTYTTLTRRKYDARYERVGPEKTN